MKFSRKTGLIGAVIAVVMAVAVVLFLVNNANGHSSSDIAVKPTREPQMQIKQLKPSDIGLSLAARADKHAIEMKISKISGVTSIEYEATYNVEVMDQGTQLTEIRGIGPSTIDIKPSDSVINRDLELGSCSSGVCKYDKITSKVSFVLKITYQNGEVASVQQDVAI